MTYFARRDPLWLLPLALTLGAVLSSLQPGNWLIGWAGFSLVLFFAFCFSVISWRWAADYQLPITSPQSPISNLQSPAPTSDSARPQRILITLVAAAFLLRLFAGVGTSLLLPVNGYDDPDDRAGYVFTDAHRRDDQAWELAQSDQSILSAFDKTFHTDQYGGLLAFCALVYRVFSPDAQRPLLLILLSAFIGTLGLPFLWKSANRLWGEKVALAAGWIFALYPESVLLGGAAMREPYLMTFSAMALWGFVSWRGTSGLDTPLKKHSGLLNHRGILWLALGLAGMLLVSPVAALVTLAIFAGWLYFDRERGRVPWWALAAMVIVFVAGLFLLSSALDRQGDLGAATPFGVVNNWLREAVKWDVYQLERGSGWVQKLFDEMPEWLRLPFVVVYGVFQPVLPAAIVEPTTATWKVIAILRAAGWYALLPVLVLSIAAGSGSGAEKDRKVWLWMAVVCWSWILLASLRGGGDQWDNPRYRAILFLWQAILAGYALVRWRETRSIGLAQILACEAVFLIVFTQWYASRYFHWGGQVPFGGMVALILGLWAVILAGGWAWARRTR